MLDYGNPESLEYLRAHGSEIAAVLVEPVQGRRLDLQPREFLQEIRRVTEQTGSALIFDEVVTGFRSHPGGAQAYFDVRADLATYGKVIGGGLPIGAVTGSARFMDALDGGQWQYGDHSFPEVGMTFFAGTFVRHPLMLAAAKSVLLHLKEQGPELQARLNQRAARLAADLQAVLDEFDAPYRLVHFSSLIFLSYPSDQKHAGLLFYLLRERGIHIWENRLFVLTTAHSDEDLRQLIDALRQSLEEMRSGEFLAGLDRPKIPSAAKSAESFPLTEAQKEVWLAAQMGGEASLAYNESMTLEFTGAFDLQLFRTAAQQVVARHPILLAHLSADGERQQIGLGRTLELPLDDLIDAAGDKALALRSIVDREVETAFDLTIGPLLRVRIVRLSNERHVVVWTAHHIVCDGWSAGLLISELAKTYSALKEHATAELDAPIPFAEYALLTQGDTLDSHRALEYLEEAICGTASAAGSSDRSCQATDPDSARVDAQTRDRPRCSSGAETHRRAAPDDDGRLVDDGGEDVVAPADRPNRSGRRTRRCRAGGN